MKKLYIFFTLLLSLLGASTAHALDLPTGALSVGEQVTTLETGKWYFLYNRGAGTYALENSSNALTQSAQAPNGIVATGNEGYLVTLEDATNEQYYIKTGLGNYFDKPTRNACGTRATLSSQYAAITIETIEGYPGHFLIKGNNYNLVASTDDSTLKGLKETAANGIADWAFAEVSYEDVSKLKGRSLYNYQMANLKLFRLKNKRTSTSYLTSTANGSANGASRASTGLSQVWIAEKSGSGYTIRSANTGQYLQEDFGTPKGTATVLYFQYSPNNSETEAYANISSASDFSGQTCLNLSSWNNSLAKWTYAGDSGSDWAIELADDVTEDDVREHLNSASGYAAELKDGSYYRLYCPLYGLYATEVDGNSIKSVAKDDGNYAQYWKAVKRGNGYAFQNVLTQKYIQIQNTGSAVYQTGSSIATLYPTRTSDNWLYQWFITNSNGGNTCMHTASSQGNNVVMWYTSANASIWAFQEKALTDEEIAAARETIKAYEDLKKKVNEYQGYLDNLFEDKACTTLKSEIQALTDAQLAANANFAGLNDDIKAMILKIKNNTWKQYTNTSTGYTAGYEKFFRIADYQIYSNYITMSDGSHFTMSNNFGRLSGPTGIVANTNDIIYIYVDADPKSECTLMLETVSTDGVAGNHSTGTQSALHKGLNVYSPGQQVMLYIFHQLDNAEKYLADYPDIKIHIEGGQLNGYWDATRGMTNADWKLLQQDLLKASPFLNLKTKHLVFQMDADLVLAAEPNEMEGLMRIWEMIPTNEDRYMGVEDFEGRYNNIWNVFSGASSYMHSSTYGTWYTESTIPTVMNYNSMRQPGSIWGPSHEIGHNHQGSINIVGTTESSNNLFSNINRFEQGIQTSRCQLPVDVFTQLANDIAWPQRNIWNTTRMFFQLYLYFHAMHHDDQFLPNLFRTMRKEPFNKWSSWDNTTEFTYVEDGETKTGTGAYVTLGSKDYLHLAKKICDVAQADLSEFFEAYGMFIPVSKYHISDYSNYLVTTTQADIDEAKAYMRKYEKKLGNIMFIDDHISPMKDADPNNKFEGLPASNGKRVNDTGQHDELGYNLPVGNYGDYEDFDGRTTYSVNNDYYKISGTTISFNGTGMLGHKIYDKQGNLIWATNAKTITAPQKIIDLGPENIVVVAAEPNMTDSPCPYYNSSKSKIYKTTVNFGSEEDKAVWYANEVTDLSEYMPENTIGVIGTKSAPESIVSTKNLINTDGTAASIVLNGDLPAYIPTEATAQNVQFTKTVSGYAALDLPFALSTGDIDVLQTATVANGKFTIADAERIEAGQPVVVNGNVDITLSNATLKSASYQVRDLIALNEEGTATANVEQASPFTYAFSEILTGIEGIAADKAQQGTVNQAIYDLTGRRIQQPVKGIYIINGKKTVVK